VTEHVVLLRAVNLGSSTALRMPELRTAVGRWGARDVRSVLQSGNLVLEADERSAPAVESALEADLVRRLKRPLELFVRSAADWRAIVAENPFVSEAADDPAHLLVLLLKSTPTDAAWGRLRAAVQGRERFSPGGPHAYLVYPDGIGRSRLTPDVIERALGVRGTARNWNTVRRLEALLAP